MNDPTVCQVCGQSEENAEKPWRARVAALEAHVVYWKAKFEQEERLRDAPKLTSTVTERK